MEGEQILMRTDGVRVSLVTQPNDGFAWLLAKFFAQARSLQLNGVSELLQLFYDTMTDDRYFCLPVRPDDDKLCGGYRALPLPSQTGNWLIRCLLFFPLLRCNRRFLPYCFEAENTLVSGM